MHSPPLTNSLTSDSVTLFRDVDQLIPPLSSPAVAPVPAAWTAATLNLLGLASAVPTVTPASRAEIPRIVPRRAKRRMTAGPSGVSERGRDGNARAR